MIEALLVIVALLQVACLVAILRAASSRHFAFQVLLDVQSRLKGLHARLDSRDRD